MYGVTVNVAISHLRNIKRTAMLKSDRRYSCLVSGEPKSVLLSAFKFLLVRETFRTSNPYSDFINEIGNNDAPSS